MGGEDDIDGSSLEFCQQEADHLFITVPVGSFVIQVETVQTIVEQDCAALTLLNGKQMQRIFEVWIVQSFGGAEAVEKDLFIRFGGGDESGAAGDGVADVQDPLPVRLVSVFQPDIVPFKGLVFRAAFFLVSKVIHMGASPLCCFLQVS